MKITLKQWADKNGVKRLRAVKWAERGKIQAEKREVVVMRYFIEEEEGLPTLQSRSK